MWPYLQEQGLWGRFFASMASKMAQNCVFAAVLAGNVAHRAYACKYGRKCALWWGKEMCVVMEKDNMFARAYEKEARTLCCVDARTQNMMSR